MVNLIIPREFATRMRAIATDMDGTFFGARLCVAESTLEAYRRSIREGVQVIPTTGRAHFGVACALKAANASSDVSLFPGVFMNGCIAFGPKPCSFVKSISVGATAEGSPYGKSETTASTGNLSAIVPNGSPTDGSRFNDVGADSSLEDFAAEVHPPLLTEHRIERDVLEQVIAFVKAANMREMAKPGWEERVSAAELEHGFPAVTDPSLPPAYYSLMAYSRDFVVCEVEDQLTHGLLQFKDGETRYVGSLLEYAFPSIKPLACAPSSSSLRETSEELSGMVRSLLKKDSDLSSESTSDAFLSAEDGSAQPIDRPIYKLLLLSHSGEFVKSLRPELEALVGKKVDLVSAVPRILELNPKGCSKAEGLKHILKYLRIAPDQVAALGDGENDMQLLAACGFSIAMANATEALIKMAHATTSDNNSDGWALAVNALLDARAAALQEQAEEDDFSELE